MFEKRLDKLGIVLPEAAVPSFNYVPVTLHRGFAHVSGQLPKVNGEILVRGKVGGSVSLEVARGEARICVLQALACLKQALGTIDRIERILKVSGFVASAPGFNDQPKVLDAASDLVGEIFGEAGRHARSAIGVAELPRDVAVEIEMVAAYRE